MTRSHIFVTFFRREAGPWVSREKASDSCHPISSLVGVPVKSLLHCPQRRTDKTYPWNTVPNKILTEFLLKHFN